LPQGGAVVNENWGICPVGQLERMSNMGSGMNAEMEMMVGWAGWLFDGQYYSMKKELQRRSGELKFGGTLNPIPIQPRGSTS